MKARIVFTDKQKEFLRSDKKRINLLDGSVRSGKTTVSEFEWAKWIGQSNGNLLMTGKTLKALERNVLQEMYNNGFPIKWSLGKKEAKLFNKTIMLEGANDSRAIYKIQGLTLQYAYIDECSTMPENYYKMLLSRLSEPNSKLIATTNPDSPYHYLKKDYIDRLDINYHHFVIDDNTNLDKDYVNSLKKEYTGLWYKRYILGQWVSAEGAIYDMLDGSQIVDKIPPILNYFVGIDYGTSNQTVFLLVGQSKEGKLYVIKEYVYDSKKKMKQKTDGEYATDLKEFIKGIPLSGIYVDPSALSFAVQCKRYKINTTPADNEVIKGIRFTSNLFTTNNLYIHRSCKNTIEQLTAYSWCPQSQVLGIDKPLKENDHCPDALRYVINTTRRYWEYLLKI